jgi:hypothetical protein
MVGNVDVLGTGSIEEVFSIGSVSIRGAGELFLLRLAFPFGVANISLSGGGGAAITFLNARSHGISERFG